MCMKRLMNLTIGVVGLCWLLPIAAEACTCMTPPSPSRGAIAVDVVFVGDARVAVPPLSSGIGELIGVPFKGNIPEGDTLSDHIIDQTD